MTPLLHALQRLSGSHPKQMTSRPIHTRVSGTDRTSTRAPGTATRAMSVTVPAPARGPRRPRRSVNASRHHAPLPASP